MSFRIQCDECGEWFDSDSNHCYSLTQFGICNNCNAPKDGDGSDDNDDDGGDDDGQGSEFADMVRCMGCGKAYDSDSDDAEAIEEHGECIKCGNFNDGD